VNFLNKKLYLKININVHLERHWIAKESSFLDHGPSGREAKGKD